MNRQQIKNLLSEYYPDKMIFSEGHRVKLGNSPTRYKRLSGSSLDFYFSVEMIGRPTNLKMVKFMLPNYGPAKEKGINTIAEVLQSMYPENEKGKWLRETAESIKPGDRLHLDGRVGLEAMTLADIDVLFVTVR